MSEVVTTFRGAVRRMPAGANEFCLDGVDAASGLPLTALFTGVAAPAELPSSLDDLSLRALDGDDGTWELAGRGRTLRIVARALHLHLAAGAPFLAAVHLPRASLWQRCRWALLLGVLRVPGVASLLRRLGGSAT